MNYLSKPELVDLPALNDRLEELKELQAGLADYISETTDYYKISEGIEQLDNLLSLASIKDEEELKTTIELTGIGYGIENIDDALNTIKKAAVAVLKFIINILDRVIKFITSFFNKGMNYTEKFFIARIQQHKDNLERAIDNKNLNKNQPLDIKEKAVKKILKRKDLFILEAIKNNNTIDPGLVTNYVRGTLTLFTDNIVIFDNTCDSLVNLTKDLRDSTITTNSFIGFAAEKNKFLIVTLGPLTSAYNRNNFLSKIVEIGLNRNKKDGFVTYIIPLPKLEEENDKIAYVSISIKKSEVISKMKYEDIKSMGDLLSVKQDFIDYKDLGINIDKLDSVKIKSASFTEIDNIVQIYRESSEKIKKKLNTDRITRKLDKLKKKMVGVNANEFDSKVSNFKLQYINTSIKTATTILEGSKQLYSSGYCDSIKDYILNHTL